jgi:hypothetical protein
MASPGYTVNNGMAGTQQNVVATPGITIVRIGTAAASTKRFFIWELDLGQSGPPNATDCSVQWWLVQCSAAGGAFASNGTGTFTQVAIPTGGGYVAGANTDVAVTLTGINYSAEPTTYTPAQSFYFKAVNQRGAAFWQAAPGGEMYFPQTVSTGPGMRAYSATYASTAIARMNFTEI